MTATTVRERVGRNIKVEARRRAITIRQLARSLDVSEQTLHNRLSGKAGWNVEDLVAAATALGLDSVEPLFEGVTTVSEQGERSLPWNFVTADEPPYPKRAAAPAFALAAI